MTNTTWAGETGAPGAVLPPYLPAIPTMGLIASARDALANPSLTPPDARWQAGFTYAPGNCVGGDAIDPCDSADLLTIAANQGRVIHQPVVLWAGDHCSPNDRTRDYRGRARMLLLNDRSRQLAHEFWTGTASRAAGYNFNRFLADDTNVDVVSVTALHPVDALACLEDRLAGCGGDRFMVHCTLGTATQLLAARAIEKIGTLLVTANDSIVVADRGYPGTGPHGQAAVTGDVWMYGTNTVDVRLDDQGLQVIPDLDMQALERSQDTFFFRAEQFAAASWSGCCHVGVPVDMTFCSHHGGS